MFLSKQGIISNSPPPPAGISWQQLSAPSMPGRDSAAVAVLNNKAYVMMGWNPAFTPNNRIDMWEYTPLNTWTQLPNVPFGQANECCCLTYNGKIWLVGVGAGQDESWSWNGSWTQEETGITHVGNRRNYAFGITPADNCILICGGFNRDNGDWRADIIKSDNTGKNFSIVVANSPFGIMGTMSCRMAEINGEIGLLGGGRAYDYLNPKCWTTANGTVWNDRGILPYEALWSVGHAFNGNVYMTCGWHVTDVNNGFDLNDTYYRPTWTSSWTPMTVPFPARHAPVIFEINGALYLTTGRSNGVMIQDLWKLS